MSKAEIQTPSIFVRFRFGKRLDIEPNIKIGLKAGLEIFQKSKDLHKDFICAIEEIKDGSGSGIHPNSTWLALFREILENYSRRSKLDEETKKCLIKLFELILKKKSIQDNWDNIKEFIIKNINILSGWQQRNQYFTPFEKEVFRENGKYYFIEDGEKIQVIGAKTAEEERFDYIAEDVSGPYGLVGQLLRSIALIDIAEEYKKNPKHFKKNIVCSLPDNDSNSAYIHWQWYLVGPHKYMPVFWSPRSHLSDPKWLANDLLSSFAEKEEFTAESVETTEADYDINQFNKAFSDKYPYQCEVALSTHISLSQKNEVYFEFEDRYVRWVNGSRFTDPVLIVPSEESNIANAREIAKRFISMLVKETDMPIKAEYEIGHVKSLYPRCLNTKSGGGMILQPRFIESKKADSYSEKKWLALAMFKEGVNASSSYYEFLNFYKIIQLAHGEKKAIKWINANIKNVVKNKDSEWLKNLPKNQTAGAYLYNSGRCAIAHIEFSRKKKALNPDDDEDRKRISKDLSIVKLLAKKIIKENF